MSGATTVLVHTVKVPFDTYHVHDHNLLYVECAHRKLSKQDSGLRRDINRSCVHIVDTGGLLACALWCVMPVTRPLGSQGV